MITPSQIPNPYVKPKWQASVGVMESVVAYNCHKYGMPRPVLAMPMWEGAGNRAIDLSGHGRNVAIAGSPKWVNRGLDFDGTNDWITVADQSLIDLPTTYNFTANVWFNADVASDSKVVLCWEGTDDIAIYPNAGSYQRVYWRDLGGNILSNPSSDLSDSWHLITLISRASDNHELYFDGILVDQSSATGTVGPFTSLTIGSLGPGLAYEFDGKIDNVSIYNTALSAAQVKFLSDNPYFMYRMPEELYGYAAAAAGVTIPVFLHHYNQMRQ